MDNLKKLNLKKQLLSLKYCYEELIIENKALSSNCHFLELLFKKSKYYLNKINSKLNFDFNFKNDKRYLLISNQKNNLRKNINKQNNTLKKSILFNKYNELTKEKEYLIQILEEKKNNLKSIQDELNLYKINNPYNAYNRYRKLKSKIYLNETLDIPDINKKIIQKNNNTNISLINPKFKRAIKKKKIGLYGDLEKRKNEMKNYNDYCVYNFRKRKKELGFTSILKNKKNNKTYIISIEPNQLKNNNSSDSDSDKDNNFNQNNSINERLFADDIQNSNYIKYKNINKIQKKTGINIFTNGATLANKQINSIYKRTENNLNNMNTEFNLNISTQNFMKNSVNITTEANNEKTSELNNKLLEIKEIYYNCLDKRYQTKRLLKEHISQIYKTKEKIKKIKKQKNLKS
jgi:hypothetical protein